MLQTSNLKAAPSIAGAIAVLSFGAQPLAAQPSLIGRSKNPIQGAVPGPKMDAIRPGRLLIDPPTLENLGFSLVGRRG